MVLIAGKSLFSLKSAVAKVAVVFLICILSVLNISAQIANEPIPGLMAGQPVNLKSSSGLLFYLSGSNDFRADFSANGHTNPNFLKDVAVISSGASGHGFQADDDQLFSYWAPGNIFAQRGTISFFWRSRYATGSTPFPIFRVSYADHSSWDMTWLRIDYNGAGFDAFITDIGLSRTRVSYFIDSIPGPQKWTHFALSWDETEGIRFYVNGKIAAVQSVSGTVYDAGLDQFGPHSRIISPYQVQSAYNFMRGGDIDEIRIYDRMLPDEAISGLSVGKAPSKLPVLIRDLKEKKWRDAWWLRNGWNLPNSAPPGLPSKETSIRKVEIAEAYDIKRSYWKANDGIRETTWPGVYNMSRLPGRYDYFVLPDWDCYSGSGQSVRFYLPDEEWNHIEIWGKAWGQLTLEDEKTRDNTFAIRTKNQVKSVHTLEESHRGGTIRFDNALIEEPIGSFDAFNVEPGSAPDSPDNEIFTLIPGPSAFIDSSLLEIASFVCGRYPADERAMMLALPEGKYKKPSIKSTPSKTYPFIHILIPYSKSGKGLDGIEIRFPSLNLKPTHDGLFPMNIRIKDPLWAMRDMADFSFSVRPGESPVLWFDTRDRILPAGHSLYISVAGAGYDLTPELLTGTTIKLVYKSDQLAREEHETDRFNQVSDLYGHIVEEHPRSSRLNLFNRFTADCNDLLSVNPGHWLGQTYRYAATGTQKPSFEIPRGPQDVPEWAFLQTEYLRYLHRLVSFYIDKRQIANGEFGGGLSDDGDLTNMWPGIAFLGIEPEKILKSLKLHMSAYYDQERPSYYASMRQKSLPLFTNGLATIITDELHALEDGIQVVAQLQLLDYGNPLYIERGMETALRIVNDVTGINSAGHRHFRSRLYGGTRIVSDDPWQWSVNRSYLVLHPAYLLEKYNGNPLVRKMIIELADGLLSHKKNNYLYTEINFATDADRVETGMTTGSKPWALLYAAYKITDDPKYFKALPPENKQKGIFDKDKIVTRYRSEITNLAINEFINTEGSVWIDRISSFNPMIQEDRLGGVALTRTNILYPQHFVSWKFLAPAKYDDVAIFLQSPSDTLIKVIAYNLKDNPVKALMTAWNLKPGNWKIRTGADINDDQLIDGAGIISNVEVERGSDIEIDFKSKGYSIIELSLNDPSEDNFDLLPDLAIGVEDIKITDKTLTVRVHNVGSAASPETRIEIKDSFGKIVGTASVPPLNAPTDLLPKWKDIKIDLFENINLRGGSVQIDPEGKINEITLINSKLNLQ